MFVVSCPLTGCGQPPGGGPPLVPVPVFLCPADAGSQAASAAISTPVTATRSAAPRFMARTPRNPEYRRISNHDPNGGMVFSVNASAPLRTAVGSDAQAHESFIKGIHLAR